MHEARARGVRGGGDGPCSLGVDGGIRFGVDGADNAGEVNDGVDAGEGIGKRTGLERRANDRRAGRIGAPGSGPDDRPHGDAAPDETRGQMPADEPGGAGDGHRADQIPLLDAVSTQRPPTLARAVAADYLIKYQQWLRSITSM